MQIHRLVSSVLFVPVHFCVSSTKTRKMFTCLPPSMMEASFQSREVEESVHVKMWFQRNQCVLLATTPTFVLLISEIRCWNLIPLLEKAGSGGACLAGRPPICASSSALSRHVQAVVHSGPLLTVIWWSHSPALRQCRPVHFLWLTQNLEWTSSRYKAPPKWCLFSIPPPSKYCSFSLVLDRERL